MKKITKYNPLSAFFSYTAGNIIVKAIPFITLPFFTRILDTSNYGLYTAYLSYEGIASILLGFGLSGTIRIAKIEYEDNFEKYVSSIYGLQILLSFFFGSLIFISYKFISFESWFNSKLLAVLLLNCLFTQIYNIATAKYTIAGEVWRTLMISFLLTILNVVLSFILCLCFYKNETYIGRILGTMLSALIVAVIIIYLQTKRNKIHYNELYWAFGLKLGIPLIFHSLSLTLLAQCDKIMIQYIIGNSEAGIYGIAVAFSGIMTVLVSSIDSAWAPWFFRMLKERRYGIALKNNNYMIVIFTTLLCLIMFVSPKIIELMTPKEYWDSMYVLPPLLVSVLFNFFYLIPVNFEYFYKNTNYIAFSTAVVASINILLNFWFINMIGYIGAAYATLISKLLLFLLHWYKAWNLEHCKIMGMCEVLISSMIAVFCSFLVVFTDDIRIKCGMLVAIAIMQMLYVNEYSVLHWLFHKVK